MSKMQALPSKPPLKTNELIREPVNEVTSPAWHLKPKQVENIEIIGKTRQNAENKQTFGLTSKIEINEKNSSKH